MQREKIMQEHAPDNRIDRIVDVPEDVQSLRMAVQWSIAYLLGEEQLEKWREIAPTTSFPTTRILPIDVAELCCDIEEWAKRMGKLSPNQILDEAEIRINTMMKKQAKFTVKQICAIFKKHLSE